MHAENQTPITLPLAPRGDRPVQLKSDSHFSGHMVVRSEGLIPQVVEVESHTEMNIGLVLAMRPDVVDVESQVMFGWREPQTGAQKRHFFDFRVSKRNGDRVAVMVKPGRKRFCANFLAQAREIADRVTADFADDVVLMTDRDICPIELHNATFLDSLKEVDPEADAAVRRAMRRIIGARRISDIVSEVGLRGRGFRAVGRLLRGRELVLSPPTRITSEAAVRRNVS
ncbi:hypothetical protein FJY63_01300 [Candidatus Sumerlaeota bacterium]|nr:hypothetical protein [Candidatus Sumerlaeota bacterium]MBM3604618.1 hypothetical protein [Alphaproteobacteria bacterium]